MIRQRKQTRARPPRPAAIRAARQKAGLSQARAGGLVHSTGRVWRQWESGARRMHPAFWDLFLIYVAAVADVEGDPDFAGMLVAARAARHGRLA